MAKITEDNQIFVYLQWEINVLLIYRKKDINNSLPFCNKEHEMQWKCKFSL